jgi:hypothetical protein
MGKIFPLSLIFLIVFAFMINGYTQGTSDASATGISRSFNPALSVNSLFYGMGSSLSDPLYSQSPLTQGLHYQEIEAMVTANVDVYLKSLVTFSASEQDGIGLEEAYITTLRMPIPATLRGGQMFNTFGQHNLLHLHHMAFADYPLILDQVFGSDLNEVSIEAAYLMPTSWYMDVTAGILNGDNPILFNSSKTANFAYLFHLDNLWDLADEYTIRLGGTYLSGQRGLYHLDDFSAVGSDTSNILSNVWGLDFHLKWKPLQRGRYRSLTLQGEYIHANLKFNESNSDPLHGYFVQLMGQFNIRWWLQFRYDWYNQSKGLSRFFPVPDMISEYKDNDLISSRISFLLGYIPTEFSAFRIQYNIIRVNGKIERQIIAQVNVTIGSHPAHKY